MNTNHWLPMITAKKKHPYHEYIFQKDKGKLEALNYTNFANALSDNEEALQRFKTLFPAGLITKKNVEETLTHLTEVAELYNKNAAGHLKEF